MKWWERMLLFLSLAVLFLCAAMTLRYAWPEGWYYLTLYRDAVYWAILIAGALALFASWRNE